jgi:hypothetical protein
MVLPLPPPAPKFITSFNKSWAVVVGTTGARAGGLKALGVRFLGLSIGFTGVTGVARTDGEKVGEILPLGDVIYKTSKISCNKINHAWDPKQFHLPLHPNLQRPPPY